MKKLIPLVLVPFLVASCYEEVVIPLEDIGQIGVMNAQFNTLDSVHEVQLSVSRDNRVYALSGAEVKVFLNGTLAATAEEMPDPYEIYGGAAWYTGYAFQAGFEPGDEIRIEAHQGNFSLSAEVTVPPAVALSSVDTSSVVMNYMGETYDYVQAKLTFNDLEGRSWYRVCGRIRDDYVYLDDGGDPVPELSGTDGSEIALETGFDPVISEGAGKTGGSDLGAMLLADNAYACFSDDPFDGRECTVRPLFYDGNVYLNDWSYGLYVPASMGVEPDWDLLQSLSRRIRRTAYMQVRSIGFSQYHYLKALQNLETFGTEMSFIVEPTTLPSNVEGGLGFVGVETVSEIRFYEEERTFPPLREIYY